jgi:hypothetical protein
MAGLSLSSLINTGLGGYTAHSTGKRAGRKDKLEENRTAAALARQVQIDAMNMAIQRSQMAENEAQRQHYLAQAEKIRRDLAKPTAPVLGTPEYRKAQRELVEDRETIEARTRPKQEWEVYGPSSDRRDTTNGAPTAGEARRSTMADQFAERYVDMFQGNVPKAVAYIEGKPALKAEASKLGLTEGHYNAATARRSAIRPGTQKQNDGDDFDALLGGGAPVATAPSSAPQPARAVAPPRTTAQALGASIPSLPPAVVKAPPSSTSNAGTRGAKAPVPTSTPRANPMRANSPKAGTPTDVPAGADPEKYRTDQRYKQWVDSISKSPR